MSLGRILWFYKHVYSSSANSLSLFIISKNDRSSSSLFENHVTSYFRDLQNYAMHYQEKKVFSVG